MRRGQKPRSISSRYENISRKQTPSGYTPPLSKTFKKAKTYLIIVSNS